MIKYNWGEIMDCIFCKIANGKIPTKMIYEDDIVSVFMDNNPDSDGHLLIVPKKHILDIDDMDDETWVHIKMITKKMRKHLNERLHPDGLTLIQNNGDIQIVKHFHLHLKPYYKNNHEIHDIEQIYNKLK